MPEEHTIVTLYFPELMKLREYLSDTTRIYKNIEFLVDKYEEKQFNLMLSPTEYNNKLDEIVREIMLLYESILNIQKLKVQK